MSSTNVDTDLNKDLDLKAVKAEKEPTEGEERLRAVKEEMPTLRSLGTAGAGIPTQSRSKEASKEI